jgi:hypothetical protein
VFQFQTIVLTDADDNDDKEDDTSVHVFMGSATANKTSQEKKAQTRDNQTIIKGNHFVKQNLNYQHKRASKV